VRAWGGFCGSRQPSLGPAIAPSRAQNPGFIALSRHWAKKKSLYGVLLVIYIYSWYSKCPGVLVHVLVVTFSQAEMIQLWHFGSFFLTISHRMPTARCLTPPSAVSMTVWTNLTTHCRLSAPPPISSRCDRFLQGVARVCHGGTQHDRSSEPMLTARSTLVVLYWHGCD
jgi:hypothetical protein